MSKNIIVSDTDGKIVNINVNSISMETRIPNNKIYKMVDLFFDKSVDESDVLSNVLKLKELKNIKDIKDSLGNIYIDNTKYSGNLESVYVFNRDIGNSIIMDFFLDNINEGVD